jgi:type VI secretion system protein ImpL
LSRTLLQLNADAQFRARAHDRETVDPEWYRRKALALLTATHRLQHDAIWTKFLPGSWRTFDNLEERIQARLESEFSEIVVETMRRELYAQASRLTGVALVRGPGDLQMGGDCVSPVPQNVDRRLSADPEDLPEFVAVTDYVAGVERLDAAVQSFLSLQYGKGDAQQLRQLVAFTLGKDLPDALEGAVRMFPGSDEVNVQPALMRSRLQWATRCSLLKGMSALHTRLLNTNDLFALEQGYVERSTGLFEASARPAAFDRTLERYRAVRALLDDQDALLAKGRNDWMGQGTLQLGPAYQAMMRKVEHTRLLGPDVVQQLQNQSGAAFLEFRRQFEQAFGKQGEPGIVWIEGEKRFGLSTERAALRQGLGALLQASFMADETSRKGDKDSPETAGLSKALQDARTLADERTRALAEVVPIFPEPTRPVVTRAIDARVSELIYQRAFRALKAALPAQARAPLDTLAFKQQRDQVIALQAVLKETGGGALGNQLAATLDGELLRRLAAVEEEWKQQPVLQDPKLTDFSWWQGDVLPLAKTLGAGEGAPASFGRTATQMDLLVQQARALLALGSPTLATDPAATRWLQLQTEVERYTARAPNSSLLRLENYVTALGPDLRRDNCAERLLANAPPGAVENEIARRHVQLHNALASRCNELRAQASTPAASLAQ